VFRTLHGQEFTRRQHESRTRRNARGWPGVAGGAATGYNAPRLCPFARGTLIESKPDEALFAIVDLETTGFSPLVGDRIVEVAIVRVAADGSKTDEYVTLVDPQRGVGPMYVHGIAQEDVDAAPTFPEIVGDVLSRLEGVIVVGHNIRYDLDFLGAELSAAGVFLPGIPSLCTLKLGYRLHPTLSNHKLATCCAAAGLPNGARTHDALGDAGATAQLLSVYLREAQAEGMSIQDLLGDNVVFPTSWPSMPLTNRRAGRVLGRVRAETPYLARVVAGLSGVHEDEEIAPYMDLLERALEDFQVTEAEGEALRITAEQWGLTREQVVGAHHDFMRALVVAALADGRVTATERRDLDAAATLLALGPGIVDAFLYEEAETI
jgi:DNA polymerase III epsilon subunit-like protein